VPDLEFLPTWYQQAQRRRRRLLLQAWGSLIVCCALVLWLSLVHRNVATAAQTLSAVDGQLHQSELELVQLQEQLRLKGELELQRQIVSRIGLPLEMSRLVRTLEDVMPKEMSLVELNVETEEQLARPTPNATVPVPARNATPDVDRRLVVRVVGVAPSDVDLANFLAGLTAVPFFENVAMAYSKDKAQAGHVLREFEVSFSLNLNRSAVGE
jgi:Tfp pilus assembly protein PilN